MVSRRRKWIYTLESRRSRKWKTMRMIVKHVTFTDIAVDSCACCQGRPVSWRVVVVRLEHSHSFIDSLDNHSTASGPAWCRRCMPPGNAVSGHSSTMCLVVWWLSPQGQAGDAITPHRWRDSAYLAWPHLRRFSVTNWRLDRVNPGCGHVGSVTRSCPGCSLESTTAPMSPAPFVLNSRVMHPRSRKAGEIWDATWVAHVGSPWWEHDPWAAEPSCTPAG